MYEFFGFISLLLSIVGIIVLYNKLSRWADKPTSGVDKLPDVGTGELTPEHTIFVILGGEQKGPYTREQVMQMSASGVLPADALCWQPGDTDWRPVSQLSGGPAASPTPPNTPGPGAPGAPPGATP